MFVIVGVSAVLSVVGGLLSEFAFLAKSNLGVDYSHLLRDPMWRASNGRLVPYMAANIVSNAAV